LIGKYRYKADISGSDGWIDEKGPDGRKRYRIEHALGGKTVCYFLTRMENSRLQTLPIAYDVGKKQWFDMVASGVRHFPGREPDRPVDWRDWPYTFNTACYSCHVSQLFTNYDLTTDTYDTYNLGSYHLGRQDYAAAAAAYETAIRFGLTEVPSYVNLSIAHARQGQNEKAEAVLDTALKLEPDNAEANFNMGLLKAGFNDPSQAEKHLRRALKADSQMASAAYNLYVLLGEKRTDEALGFCLQAVTLQPADSRYAWTYAYYQKRRETAKRPERSWRIC
jgi:tetratricopeptide (TPR) repeat protein